LLQTLDYGENKLLVTNALAYFFAETVMKGTLPVTLTSTMKLQLFFETISCAVKMQSPTSFKRDIGEKVYRGREQTEQEKKLLAAENKSKTAIWTTGCLKAGGWVIKALINVDLKC
jgi:hypothetical protein